MIFKYQKPQEEFISLGHALREIYDFQLNDSDWATHNMIERYWKILSYRLIRKYNQLREKGREQAREQYSQLILFRNPWLESIKNHSTGGMNFPTPTIYYKGDDHV